MLRYYKSALQLFFIVIIFSCCDRTKKSIKTPVLLKFAQYDSDSKLKYGFMDLNGEAIIKPKFDNAINFSEGLGAVRIGKKWGFVDSKGDFQIPAQYDGVYAFSNNMAAIKVNGKWGYINNEGKLVIIPTYEEVINFNENGFAAVNLDDETVRLIRRDGSVICEKNYKYDYLYNTFVDFGINNHFEDNSLLPVRHLNKYGYINEDLEMQIKPQFDHAELFHENLAVVKSNGRYGYINKNGELEIDYQFDMAYDFHEGVASISLGERYGFIDKTGQITINPKFDNISDGMPIYFSEGLALIGHKKKVGYINKSGDFAIQPIFKYAAPFGFLVGNGTALIMRSENDKFEIIDKSGASLKALSIGEFTGAKIGNLIVTETEGRNHDIGLMNEKGDIILEAVYGRIEDIGDGMALIWNLDGKVGVINHRGEVIIEPKFKTLNYVGGEIFEAKHDGISGYIDSDGEFIWHIVLNGRDVF